MPSGAAEEVAEADRAGLLGIATLVASGAAEADVHAAVAEQAGTRLGGQASSVLRFLGDERAVVVGEWRVQGTRGMPVNAELDFDHRNSAIGRVRLTGRPSRGGSYDRASGELAVLMRSIGLRSSVAAPVFVSGRTWGAVVVATGHDEPLGPDVEPRLERYAGLAAAAVERAEERRALEASRLRLVEAGDDARRRLEHELHEGTQQHLLALTLKLRVARSAPDPALLDQALQDAMDANAELRELARAVFPKVLSERGLAAALQARVARSRVPVSLRELPSRRFGLLLEATAYFLADEALRDAETGQPAGEISLLVADRGNRLDVQVESRDPRAAVPARRVTDLADRVAALGGRLDVGPGSVRAELPVAP